MLYAFVLRRAELSRKNGWADEYGRVYLYYVGLDPYTFVALIDRVIIGQEKKLEFIFRNGMKYTI